MQWQRVPFQQPLGRFVLAMTDPIVLPLRRVLPRGGVLDASSLLAAWGVKLLQYALLWLLAGAHASAVTVLWLSVMGLVQLFLSSLSALVMVNAILSWVQPGSTLYHLSARLCHPFLQPVRRLLPLIGGVDLSPLALLLVLQLLGIVLANLMHFPLT
jgi:YggT family protein